MMEGTTSSKTEVIKPLFFKAGVPLVVSLAGFVCARFVLRSAQKPYLEDKVTRIDPIGTPKLIDDSEPRNNSSNSTFLRIKDDSSDDEEENMNMVIKSSDLSDVFGKAGFDKEEMVSLRDRVDELQKMQLDMETKFLEFCILKEQESALLELKGMLMLENARVEFLDREVSSMKAEKERMANLVTGSIRVSKHLCITKIENRLLQRKVKKLLWKAKEQFQVIREKNLKIKEIEAQVLRFRQKLEMSSDEIMKLGREVSELKKVVSQLQEEKDQALLRLNSVENSISKPILQIESEGLVKMEDHKHILDELEQLRKDQAKETTELIYLRWTNACLRHELMRSHAEQHQQIEEKKKLFKLLEHEDHETDKHQGSAGEASNNVNSKRKHFLQKIKKWVEGNETIKPKLDEKVKHDSHGHFKGI